MKIERILKFTRNYRGLFDERISTWLFKKFIKNREYKGITWFNDEEISIYYTSNEYIERRIWMIGEYETEVKSIFNTFVAKDSIVLDIGANIGINTIRLSKCVGAKGKVYSFEPVPFNQIRFQKNINLNKIHNVKLEPIALGLITEIVKITINENEENMGAVSLRNFSKDGISIQVKNGDQWVKENNLLQIDFIKIDVEGFEWNVLLGLSEAIKKFHPKILIEWDLNYLTYIGVSTDVWQNFVDENNYKLFQISRYELKELYSIREAVDGNLLLL